MTEVTNCSRGFGLRRWLLFSVQWLEFGKDFLDVGFKILDLGFRFYVLGSVWDPCSRFNLVFVRATCLQVCGYVDKEQAWQLELR